MNKATVQYLVAIYYGWMIADEEGHPNAAAALIAAARPAVLVAPRLVVNSPVYNLSPQVRALLQAAGVQIFAYVPTDYGNRDLGLVRAEVSTCLREGVEGIFFDEVNYVHEDPCCQYYHRLAAQVKGAGRVVILNTGVAQTDEAIMDIADILMVEHQWRVFYQTCSWRTKYPSTRFMGCSSNEPGAYAILGHVVDASTAPRLTNEAWSNSIGWLHCVALVVPRLCAAGWLWAT
jgi:hypothetical protein